MYTYWTPSRLGTTVELLGGWIRSRYHERHPFGDNVVCQVGLIVEDIERTAQRYAEISTPVPPVHVTLAHDVTRRRKGEPSDATAKLAFFDFGQVQIG